MTQDTEREATVSFTVTRECSYTGDLTDVADRLGITRRGLIKILDGADGWDDAWDKINDVKLAFLAVVAEVTDESVTLDTIEE